MKRNWIMAGLFLVAATGLSAQDDPDREIEGGGVLEAGWEFRTDNSRGMENVRFERIGSGLQLSLGPRIILYRPDDVATDNFTVSATFRQAAATSHPEAYGLIIGGSDLRGSDQKYTYFLIRGNGQALVKSRSGARTTNVSSGWVANSAINAVDTDGRSVNELSVSVNGSTLSFMVNGTEVYSGSTANLEVDGIFGIRANHSLELVVEGFSKTD
jgi:hypothetical protein